MFEAIERDAQVARRISDREILLGDGRLVVEIPFPLLSPGDFSYSKKNVICGARIAVEQANSGYYPGRSANLWFGEFTPGEFRWYEIPYMMTLGVNSGKNHNPYGITRRSEIQDADYAAGPIMHSVQHAATPVPIDGEHADDFNSRWLNRLAEASINRLQRPSCLPE